MHTTRARPPQLSVRLSVHLSVKAPRCPSVCQGPPLSCCPPQVTDEANSSVAFSDVKFSYDGKYMLAVVEGKVYVLDAYNGNVLQRFSNGAPEGCSPVPEAAFSMDSQFVLSGTHTHTPSAWTASLCSQVHTHLRLPDRGCCQDWCRLHGLCVQLQM